MSFQSALFLALALASTPVLASSCDMIRDNDTRMTCLAIERGERSSCASVRSDDQRALCSTQADQAKRLKDQERR